MNCDALATDNIISDGSAVVIGWETHKRDRRCDEYIWARTWLVMKLRQ